MPVVGAALAVGGAVLGGLSAKAKSESDAEQLRRQAKQAQEIGAITDEAFRVQASSVLASSIAASGASGIMQDDFDETRENFARDAKLQSLRIQSNTVGQVNALTTSADNTIQAGKIAMFGSFMNAGASLLGSPGLFQSPGVSQTPALKSGTQAGKTGGSQGIITNSQRTDVANRVASSQISSGNIVLPRRI